MVKTSNWPPILWGVNVGWHWRHVSVFDTVEMEDEWDPLDVTWTANEGVRHPTWVAGSREDGALW